MQTVTTTTKGRFAVLLGGSSNGRGAHDRPLLGRSDWVVAPTIGSIVPNWLIAVPRTPALSFRDWKDKFGKLPNEIHSDLCQHLGIASTEIVWFEHGPTNIGSTVGCGTDYAHLHFLFRPSFTFSAFAQEAVLLSELAWKSTTFDAAYEDLPSYESYLVAGSGEEVIFTSRVESVGSQFFRRVVSSFSDRADAWDYKRFPHTDNITQTIANFRVLESAMRRGR